MLTGRRCAITDTTIIIPTPVRLTVTTGLTGSRVECLSAPVRGMAGDARGVGVVGVAALDEVLTAMTVGSGAAGSPATGALTVEAALTAVRLASMAVAGSGAVADSMAAVADSMAAMVGSTAVEDSTVVAAAADSTVAAVEDSTAAVADTGNR